MILEILIYSLLVTIMLRDMPIAISTYWVTLGIGIVVLWAGEATDYPNTED